VNLKKRKIFKRTSVKLGFKSEWLTVISFYGYKKRYNVAAWLCRCKCGREMLRTAHEIKIGLPKSCGCYFPPNLSDLCKTHGLSRHPL